MITTSNLGLTLWDSEKDDFEHSQLADNFVRIDGHSHLGGLSEALNSHDELEGAGHWTNAGEGVVIQTGAIEPGAIKRYLIKERAVGHKQIGLEEVRSENIAEHNVLNKHIANEAVDDRTIKHETITIDKLDPNIISLGSVMLWFKYSPSAEPGNLWHVCDGTSWASIPNALGLTEGHIPDLREKFARGTDLNHTGEVGGSSSVDLTHHHSVAAVALNHTHTIGSHNHVIGLDGLHNHGFVAEGGGNYPAYQRLVRASLGVPPYAGALHLPQNTDTGPEHTDVEIKTPISENGEHSHGGYTGLSAAYGTGGSSLGGSIETDEQLKGVSVTPPFVGLCYILRVR